MFLFINKYSKQFLNFILFPGSLKFPGSLELPTSLEETFVVVFGAKTSFGVYGTGYVENFVKIHIHRRNTNYTFAIY